MSDYLTVSVAVPVMLPDAAEMTVLPTVTAVALPVAALIVAVAGVPDVQVQELVRTWVEPSEYCPVAVNCCCCPAVRPAGFGVTVMDSRFGLVGLPIHPA